VQCDFDGTVTEKDVSFMLLDAFADGDWRQWDDKHDAGTITVGRFNQEVFSMVRAGRREMLEYMKPRVTIRLGFENWVAYCRSNRVRLVIVSNGLRFYIEEILGGLGLADVEVHAAETEFFPGGLHVRYVGPDGTVLDDGFKESYVDSLLQDGNRLAYVGDGGSDLRPARGCHRVFATGRLLELCRRDDVACTPFTDFNDIIAAMESP
jgi:2-hydroxy-3-keto-5-methylthiopentenyl-1-phosphate phosphatase